MSQSVSITPSSILFTPFLFVGISIFGWKYWSIKKGTSNNEGDKSRFGNSHNHEDKKNKKSKYNKSEESESNNLNLHQSPEEVKGEETKEQVA